jgi:hypothetical protein
VPKLHEILAVNTNLAAQAAKTRTELMETFKKKVHHFTEKQVSFQPFEEGQPPVVESQLDLQTTVKKELVWLAPFLDKAIDAAYQVAEANTSARADVVLDDGTVLLSNMPATSLLELEKRAKELHDFVYSIPTLDPAKGFSEDSQRGDGVYRARDDHKKRTKKETKVLVLAPATDKHPAQAQTYVEDVPIGDIVTLEWSGLLTVADKGDMLSRVEDFTRAVKQARSRANDLTVDTRDQKIGQKITDFIFGQ